MLTDKEAREYRTRYRKRGDEVYRQALKRKKASL